MDWLIKISIITPSYNQGRFIERTLLSVLTQNVSGLEYFVVDGGSQDETLSILHSYASRLRFISEKDRGQAHAVNKGLQQTTGGIIGWLNSDDVYYPGALNKVCEFFCAHPEVDILYGNADHIDQDDKVIERYPTEPWKLERLKKTCYLSQPAVFFRRSLLDRFGSLEEQLQYCMDYEYWLRLGLGGVSFHHFPEVLAGSRLYPETKTLRAPLEAQHETLCMLRNKLGLVPTEWLLTYAVTSVKHKTNFRCPGLGFIFSTWAIGSYSALRWNGLLQGVQSCFRVPLMMWAMYRKDSF